MCYRDDPNYVGDDAEDEDEDAKKPAKGNEAPPARVWEFNMIGRLTSK